LSVYLAIVVAGAGVLNGRGCSERITAGKQLNLCGHASDPNEKTKSKERAMCSRILMDRMRECL
jgi:hypothetical protein